MSERTAHPNRGGQERRPGRRPVVLAWQVPWHDKSFPSFQAHADLITHISPTWFTIDARGEIASVEDKKTRPVAEASGSLLVPLIANEKFNPDIVRELVDSAERRSRLARRLNELVLDRRFDGLNLDFEGPFGSHRREYAQFVEELGWHLKKAGRELSVDVVCQTKDPSVVTPVTTAPTAVFQTKVPPHASSALGSSPAPGSSPDEVIASWAAAFDYRSLGEAVDLFILMGYDYHGRLSEPGPVSSVKWLREVLAHTLARVPAQKAVLGLPFYGRRWDIDPDGKPSEGKGVFWDDVASLKNNRAIATSDTYVEGWDKDAESPWFSWEDADGRHIIHYDDATSLAAKLRLVAEYELAGVAFWCLSGEPDAMWQEVKSIVGTESK